MNLRRKNETLGNSTTLSGKVNVDAFIFKYGSHNSFKKDLRLNLLFNWSALSYSSTWFTLIWRVSWSADRASARIGWSRTRLLSFSSGPLNWAWSFYSHPTKRVSWWYLLLNWRMPLPEVYGWVVLLRHGFPEHWTPWTSDLRPINDKPHLATLIWDQWISDKPGNFD